MRVKLDHDGSRFAHSRDRALPHEGSIAGASPTGGDSADLTTCVLAALRAKVQPDGAGIHPMGPGVRPDPPQLMQRMRPLLVQAGQVCN